MGNPDTAGSRATRALKGEVDTGSPAGRGPIVGRIAASLLELDSCGRLEFPVLAPFMAGLPARALPAAGLLAIHDINGLLFAALAASLARPDGLVAAIFACDAMRSPERIARELRAHGVARVLAFPSIGAFDGRVRRDLAEYGVHYEAELAALSRLRALGFETIATAVDGHHLTAARRHGLAAVLVAQADLPAMGRLGPAERLLVSAPDETGLVISAPVT